MSVILTEIIEDTFSELNEIGRLSKSIKCMEICAYSNVTVEVIKHFFIYFSYRYGNIDSFTILTWTFTIIKSCFLNITT